MAGTGYYAYRYARENYGNHIVTDPYIPTIAGIMHHVVDPYVDGDEYLAGRLFKNVENQGFNRGFTMAFDDPAEVDVTEGAHMEDATLPLLRRGCIKSIKGNQWEFQRKPFKWKWLLDPQRLWDHFIKDDAIVENIETRIDMRTLARVLHILNKTNEEMSYSQLEKTIVKMRLQVPPAQVRDYLNWSVMIHTLFTGRRYHFQNMPWCNRAQYVSNVVLAVIP